MGREVAYCFKCANQIVGSEFESDSGRTFRVRPDRGRGVPWARGRLVAPASPRQRSEIPDSLFLVILAVHSRVSSASPSTTSAVTVVRRTWTHVGVVSG